MLKRFHLLLLLALVVFGCTEESNPNFDTENFTTIFDNSKFDIGYSPIDMVQTPDGGYLILGSRKLTDSNFSGIYLLKADKNGNFVSELEVDEDETYVNPVGRFTQIGERYYFFSMEYPSLVAQITSIDVNLENITFTQVAGINGVNPTYPSVSSLIDNNSFLLQCYDHQNRQTGLLVVPISGTTSAGRGFTIGVGAADNVDESIINSFLNAGRKFPYEVGKVGSLYFFNGFFDYNFSLVFTNLNPDSDPNGVVFGQQPDFNGGFSSIISLSSSRLAASTFYFGENYIMPNAAIPILGFSSMTPDELPGYSFPELVTNAKVKILPTTINSKNVLIYGSDTKTKQIGLFFYDETSAEFLGSRYLGFSNPFEIASIINTSDGGIAVCGTTYVAGRFARICIFKLSKEEIAETVK